MENLFFLVVVLIIVVSNVLNIRKRLRKQQEEARRQAEGPPPQKVDEPHPQQVGWRETVQKLFEQLKEELEPVSEDSQKAPGRRRSPDGPVYETPAEQTVKSAPEKAARVGSAETAYRAAEERRAAKKRRDPEASVGRHYAGAGKAMAAADMDVRRDSKTPAAAKNARGKSAWAGDAYSVAHLQKAVIWSEILGHPVSLRKEGQEPWQR